MLHSTLHYTALYTFSIELPGPLKPCCVSVLCCTYYGHVLLLQGAINFAVQSSGAKSVKLVLFTEADLAAGKSTHEITLDPATNKTGGPCQAGLLWAWDAVVMWLGRLRGMPGRQQASGTCCSSGRMLAKRDGNGSSGRHASSTAAACCRCQLCAPPHPLTAAAALCLQVMCGTSPCLAVMAACCTVTG